LIIFANGYFLENYRWDLNALKAAGMEALFSKASLVFCESYVYPTALAETTCTEVKLNVFTGDKQRKTVITNVRQLPDGGFAWVLMEAENRASLFQELSDAKDALIDELLLANKKKDPRASELLLANIEKDRRADELVLANKEKVKQEGTLANFREKSRFFATMSHEMRTPLNGILSAIQLLDDGQLISEQQKFLDAARISGDILLEHINNVLIIERNDNSQLELCDVSVLASDVLTTMNPLAIASKQLLCLDKRGLDDRKVITDRRAIQQILMNLISNAIKFSSDGDIKLRVFYGKFKDGNLALHLEVSDSGPGIS
jgi:signal transduction histidine kinase